VRSLPLLAPSGFKKETGGPPGMPLAQRRMKRHRLSGLASLGDPVAKLDEIDERLMEGTANSGIGSERKTIGRSTRQVTRAPIDTADALKPDRDRRIVWLWNQVGRAAHRSRECGVFARRRRLLYPRSPPEVTATPPPPLGDQLNRRLSKRPTTIRRAGSVGDIGLSAATRQMWLRNDPRIRTAWKNCDRHTSLTRAMVRV